MNITRKNTFVIILISLCISRIIVGLYYPLVPDEAYYFLWGKNLQLSYIDHPFITALWGVFGQFLGVRYCRVLSALGGLVSAIAVYKSAILIFPSDKYNIQEHTNKAYLATLIWSFLPGTNIVFTTLTPDAPLLCFLSLNLWSFCYWLSGSEKEAYWKPGVLFGVTAGLACESKYSALLFVLPLVFFMACHPRKSIKYKRISLLAGLFSSLILLLPSFAWNIQHDWVGYFKHAKRFQSLDLSKAVQYLSELIGGQLLWGTPVTVILMGYALWIAKGRGKYLLFFLIIPSSALFLSHVLFERIQVNWLCFLYIPLSIVCMVLPVLWQRIALVSALTGTILLYIQILFQPIPLTAHQDPSLRMSAGWKGLSKTIQTKFPEQNIILQDYALASVLRLEIPREREVYSTDYRWKWLGRASKRIIPGILIRPLRGNIRPDQNTICRYRDNRFESVVSLKESVRCYEATFVDNQSVYEVP